MKFYTILLTIILSFPYLLSAQILPLEVEPNHSTVGFAIDIAGFSVVTGKFKEYQIHFDLDTSNFTNSKVKAIIQAASIDTGIPGRDDHLRSEDFFETDAYPEITFESDSITQVNYANFIAHGKFNMHGIESAIDLPFSIVKMDGSTVGIKIRTKINRLDYGVGSGFSHTSMPDFLSDSIDVQINFWTRKRKTK